MADPTVPVAFTVEQQRALALASARQRLQEQTPEAQPQEEDWGRAIGLTARAAGPQAVGAGIGAAAGSVIPGVGTVFGAGAGALAATLVQMADRLGGTNYLDQIMTKLGLPEAKTKEEKLGVAGAEAMAGMGGMSAAAKQAAPLIQGIKGKVLEALGQSPGVGAASAASGGVAQEAVAQEGGGPTEQFVANLVASAGPAMAAPAVKSAFGAAKRVAGDTVAAVRAATGHKPSIERLASDAATKLASEDPAAIRAALENAETFVPGTKPTAAEAVAQANLRDPSKQVGGAVVKMQEELSGAKGIEDVLPSGVAKNQAALDAYLRDVSARTGMLRNAAFENARRGPAGPGLVTGTGPVQGADPLYVSRVAQYALKDRTIEGYSRARGVITGVLRDLNRVTKNAHGRVDPEVMYGIRQSAGDKLASLMKDQPTPNDAVAMRALRQLQNAIDDSIEQGGAIGWKAYLREHARLMKPVDQHTERLREATRISQGVGARSPSDMVKEELPQLPNLLSRPALFANFVLKLVAKDATTPVMREVATRMQDPEQFAQLIKRPEGTAARNAVNQTLMHAAILTNLIQKHQQSGGNESP